MRDELLRGVTPVHVECEKTVVLAALVTGLALQLSLVITPDVAIVIYVSLDSGHEWENAI